MSDWLDRISVGDEVVVSDRYNIKICKVERRTKTLIVVDGQRFNRRGRTVGGTAWSWGTITEATPERRAEVAEILQEHEDKRARNALRHYVRWAEVPIEIVRALNVQLADWIKS